MNTFLGFIILLILGAGYFIPTIIAYRRGHPQKDPIFLINLLFGLTIIGWVVSLIWSTSDIRGRKGE